MQLLWAPGDKIARPFSHALRLRPGGEKQDSTFLFLGVQTRTSFWPISFPNCMERRKIPCRIKINFAI